jgi:hypothetical protein
MVTPYYEQGNVLRFLSKNPHYNRFKLVSNILIVLLGYI